jgi:hypothetical protein
VLQIWRGSGESTQLIQNGGQETKFEDFLKRAHPMGEIFCPHPESPKCHIFQKYMKKNIKTFAKAKFSYNSIARLWMAKARMKVRNRIWNILGSRAKMAPEKNTIHPVWQMLYECIYIYGFVLHLSQDYNKITTKNERNCECYKT